MSKPCPAVADVNLSVSIGHPNVTLLPSDRPGFLKVKVTSFAGCTATYDECLDDDGHDSYAESRYKSDSRETIHYLNGNEIMQSLGYVSIDLPAALTTLKPVEATATVGYCAGDAGTVKQPSQSRERDGAAIYGGRWA